MRMNSGFRWCARRLVAPLAVLAFVAPGAAAEVTGGAGIRLAAGLDSNPLLVTDDGPSGAFALMEFDARLDAKPSPACALFVRSEGWSRTHSGGVSNADAWGGELRAGVMLPRLGTSAQRVSLALGARAATRHDTFVDRATGRIYALVLPTAPASSAPIPDRFDSESTGAFLNARYRTSPRVLLAFDGRVDAVDYTQDYGSIPSLGSLDFRSTVLEPGIYLKVAEPLSVGLSVAFTSIDYAQQPALDASGAPAAGTTRRYGSREVRLVVAYAPDGAWGARFGHRVMDREDAHAGYYSYSASTSYLTLTRRLAATGRIEVQAIHSTLDYDHAIVPGSPDGALQGSGFSGLTARYDRAVGRASVRWFSEAGLQHAASHDPVYAYDRQWVMTGMEFRR